MINLKTIYRRNPGYVSELGTGLLFIGRKIAVILAVVGANNRAGGFSDFVLKQRLFDYFSFYKDFYLKLNFSHQ